MIDIQNRDCMDLLRETPDKYFDLAIVDPPYGSSIMAKNKFQRHRTTDTTYRNKTIPTPEYYEQLYRVSKESIIWGCQYQMQYLQPGGSFIVWDKKADPDLHNMSACDVAWYSYRKKIRKFDGHWCGAVKCETEPTIHIHQKPVSLYEWQLVNYTKPGFKILDTHSGSASLAVAVHNMNTQHGMNLSLTATEIDKDYYEASLKRLANHQKQLKLI